MRLALVFLSLATVAGATTVFGAVDRNNSAPFVASTDKAPIAAVTRDEQLGLSYNPGDCTNLTASFLDSACHAEHRKRHASRAPHQVSTLVIGRADTRAGEP